MADVLFKNSELQTLHEFLLGLKLKGKQNRHRMRIVREIETGISQLKEEVQNLAKDFSLKDEEGNPTIITKSENGKEYKMIDIEDPVRFEYEQKLLYEESYRIDANKYKEELQSLLVAMDESETELSGNEAVVEQLIYERIENAI